MADMDSSLDDLPALDGRDQIGEGGFGQVFALDDAHCVKRLGTPLADGSADENSHLAVVESWARPCELDVLTTRSAWPLQLFGSGDAVIGYMMRRAPQDAHFELRVAGRAQ